MRGGRAIGTVRQCVAGMCATPRAAARALTTGLRQIVRAVARGARSARHHPRRTLAALALAAVLAGLVGGLAQLRVETGMDSFLPSDDPAVTQFDEFARDFGGDPVVVLLESDQPRALLAPDRMESLVRFEGALSGLPDVATVYGPGTVLNQIAGQTQELLAELTGRRDAERVGAERAARAAGADDAAATVAADSAAAAFDERYATLLAQGLPAGLPTLKNPSFITTVVFGTDGATPGRQPRPQWRFVVPSEKSIAVLVRPREGLDASGAAALADAVRATAEGAQLDARVTVSGVPAVVAALSDRTQSTAPLLGGLAIVAVAGCFLLVRWTRRRGRVVPVLTTVSAITVVLSGYGWLGRPVSLGVVAFLSVVLGIGCYYPTYLMLGAARRVVLTVAAASALSFASLALSPLPLVRDLGVTLAAGVLVSAAVGLLAPLLADRSTADPSDTATAPAGAPVHDAPDGRPRGRRRAALVALVVLTAVAGTGWAVLPAIGLRADVSQFAEGLPAADDARHVEDVIGSSGEVAVVLRGIDATSPEAFAWLQQARESVITRYGDLLRPALSPPALLPFLGPGPTAEQIAAGLRLLPRYLTSAVLTPDRSTAIMSFGIRLDELDRLAASRDDLLAGLPPAPGGYDVELVGLPLTAVRGAELVSADRVLANVLGVVAAGIVLVVGLPRRRDALVAVAAALLATGSGLFLLWLTGSELSPLTVALGSLTAAVGCEFTVVLSESARQQPNRCSRLASAVPLVTAASAIGYGVLLLSDLQVVREFGAQLAVAVVLSMLSAQLVLRAVPPRRPRPLVSVTTGDPEGATPDRSEPTLARS